MRLYYSIQEKKSAFHPRCRMKLTVMSSNFTTLIMVKKKKKTNTTKRFNLPKLKSEVTFDISRTKSLVNFNIRNIKICEEEETVKKTTGESILRQDL